MFSFLKYRVPILYYHRVGNPTGDPVMTVSKESFMRQMALLRKEDRVMALDDLVPLLASKTGLPKKAVVTFDDGYEDIYTQALPSIRTYRIPITVFLVTEWIGKKAFLSWEAIRELSREGVVFGSHTKNHPYLPSVPSKKLLEEEIRGSKEFLEDRLGREVSLFSYPLGGFTPLIKKMVEEAGYQAAFTTNRGERGADEDLYAARRIKMTERSDSFWVFRVKTSGYYEQFKRRKRPS